MKAKKSLRVSLSKWYSEVAPPIFVFIVAEIAITILSFALSNVADRIGTLRPPGSILPKLAELTLVGVVLGLVSCITRRRTDSTLVTLGTAFVVFLDLDHLPAALGFVQVIRPGHSLGLVLFTVAAFMVFRRGRPEVVFLFLSSFLGHLAADKGVLPLFAPISFSYLSLDSYMLPFAAGSVILALLAGEARRRRLAANYYG